MSFRMLNLKDREEQPELSPKELRVCEVLKNTDSKIEDITSCMSEEEVNYKSVDDFLFFEKPSKTMIGLTIGKVFGGWPGNRGEVVSLLKQQIEKGANLTRALAMESKNDYREHLKILLEIIFSESILASEPEAKDDKKLMSNLEEIAAKAANDKSFLSVIVALHQYYIHKTDNSVSSAPTDRYKTLEIERKNLQLHKLEVHSYFRSLKWLLETCCLSKDDKGEQKSIQKKAGEQKSTGSGDDHHNAGDDDIFLETLHFISDIRSEIPGTDSYLKKEYQRVSDQAEEFAVALLDEVLNEKELSSVIEMEDKFGEGVEDVFEEFECGTTMRKISLIEHAINLRCKYFVVNKNCQHLLKGVIFGQGSYRLWNDPKVKTGRGIPQAFILLLKLILSFLCATAMTLCIPVYCLLPLVNCICLKNCQKFFLEWYERPCQQYLLELWWFVAFLCLVIVTSMEDDFSQKDLPSGLTIPDIALFAFVVTYWLRLWTFFCFRVRTLRAVPSYRRNWRLIVPDILAFIEFASLLCFTIAFVLWIIHWNNVDGWRPSDDHFQTVDILWSLGSLLCFFKLAHYLKAQHTLGALNLSLFMMITKDVIYFTVIFAILLFVPFATAMQKLYSYYVVDKMNNVTHPLASYETVYYDLFWMMLGTDQKKDSEINDSDYAYVQDWGKTYFAMFTIIAVVVSFNMLIATLNHTYENVTKNVEKVEYLFSRTKMWVEYIAMIHSALPPPLNLADFKKCCCCKPRTKPNGGEERLLKKRNERISIIKCLVFRYLHRSLTLDDHDSTEYFQDVFTPSTAGRLEHVRGLSHSIEVTI